MKRLKLICLLVVAVLFAGCSQKLPVYTGDDVGMLAIPVMGTKTGRGDFIFSYKFTHSTDHDITLSIVPSGGEKFAFSEVLPAGRYSFDTVTMYAKPTITTISSVHSQSRELERPLTVEIKGGKVLIMPSRLLVQIKPGDSQEFYQHSSWQKLDDAATELMKKRLAKMENADGWEIAEY